MITGVLIANDASAQCPDTPDQVQINTIDKLLDTGDQFIRVDVIDYPDMMVDDVNHNSWSEVQTEAPNSQIDYKTASETGMITIYIKNPFDPNSCDESREVEIVENLPIELLNFDVTVKKDSVLYKYVTSSEDNVNHVVAQVQRDGDKSKKFIDIKNEIYGENTRAGRAHEIAIALEEFIDKSKAQIGEPLYGRLKSVDNDGLTVFYKNVEFELKSDGTIDEKSIKIYPVPASDKVNVEEIKKRQQIDEIKIFDIHSKLLKTVKKQNSIDVREFKSGVYIMKVLLDNGKVITKKIIVANPLVDATPANFGEKYNVLDQSDGPSSDIVMREDNRMEPSGNDR